MRTTNLLIVAAVMAAAVTVPAAAQEAATPTATAAPTLASLLQAAGWLEKDDKVVSVNGNAYTAETDAAVYEKVKGDAKFTIEVDRAGKGRATVTGDTSPPKADANNEDPASPAEMEAMAKDLRLTPLQTTAVRNAIIGGQHEFERRLVAASESGSQDMQALERIGQEVAKRTQERIAAVLFPDQRATFDEFMKKAMEEADGPGPGEGAPPGAPPPTPPPPPPPAGK